MSGEAKAGDHVPESNGAAAEQLVTAAVAEAAQRLEKTTVPALGSLLGVKEKHLTDDLKACLEQQAGHSAATRRVPVAAWSSRGAVDIVVPGDATPPRPRLALELKWCQEHTDKVHEAIWDLFKLALLSRLETVETAVLVTGAPVPMWETAFCGDIFEGGRFEPEELCSRRFPTRGSARLAWNWLLEGGGDHFPAIAPAVIETRRIASAQVHDGDRTWEIRAVSVHPSSADVPFFEGWPRGERPADARRPDLATSTDGSEELEPVPLGPRLDQAVSLARTLHFGHARKGTDIVYLSHLLAVAALVLENGGDEDEAIAALLHDAVEDQGGSRRLTQIRQLFGDRVASIVEACSDTDVEPKPPWRERKEHYLDHLQRTARPDVLRVSAADKLHNARAILSDLHEHGDDLWKRFTTASAEDQLWYYDELARLYEKQLPGRLAAELRRTVDEIERLVAAGDDSAVGS